MNTCTLYSETVKCPTLVFQGHKHTLYRVQLKKSTPAKTAISQELKYKIQFLQITSQQCRVFSCFW